MLPSPPRTPEYFACCSLASVGLRLSTGFLTDRPSSIRDRRHRSRTDLRIGIPRRRLRVAFRTPWTTEKSASRANVKGAWSATGHAVIGGVERASLGGPGLEPRSTARFTPLAIEWEPRRSARRVSPCADRLSPHSRFKRPGLGADVVGAEAYVEYSNEDFHTRRGTATVRRRRRRGRQDRSCASASLRASNGRGEGVRAARGVPSRTSDGTACWGARRLS